jgi:DNA modification methylase
MNESIGVSKPTLQEIERLDHDLATQFGDKLAIQTVLGRSLVSFQANKTRPVYRWFKYKEAFSAALVEYLLERYQIPRGRLLDPFAGSGTSLFVAAALGMQADGIELLPIGEQIIRTRHLLQNSFSPADLSTLKRWSREHPWLKVDQAHNLPELRLTKGAYPEPTLSWIGKFLAAVDQETESIQSVLCFALLCILESVSYTRKDGQYLRWDYRSNRRQGQSPFDKGPIADFDQAISSKLDEIIQDISANVQQPELFPNRDLHGNVNLYSGSCLDILPTLEDSYYDAVFTSPPYCNRYDYTRTYALELAMLGVGEEALIELRQRMLSCTVENRAKDLLVINPLWQNVINTVDNQNLLQTILTYLEDQKSQGLLNNNGLPRMVRGYFYEMACVLAECLRVMKPGAPLIMVNDNVRYAGASISVDLILSDIAQHSGFDVENILVLPNGKGNSSQQMGMHGREALRKCIYVWRRA